MSEKVKKINKKERIAFYNKLGQYIPKQDYLTLFHIQDQLEDEISDLRKKSHSVEFAKKRVKTFYLNDQEFTKFLINLIGETY